MRSGQVKREHENDQELFEFGLRCSAYRSAQTGEGEGSKRRHRTGPNGTAPAPLKRNERWIASEMDERSGTSSHEHPRIHRPNQVGTVSRETIDVGARRVQSYLLRRYVDP